MEYERMEVIVMDLRVLDLQYRLEQTQRHLKGNHYLSKLYKEDIKEIEKILVEIEAMVQVANRSNFIM